jgi:hypothetical protein
MRETVKAAIKKSEKAGGSAEAPMQVLERKMEAILKEELPKLKMREVFLTLKAADAKDVFVAGDFKSWKDRCFQPMEEVLPGVWRKKAESG